MSGFLTIVLVIVSIVIVFVVIMQPSKDGGLGGLSNGGAADSVLGTGGNAFLTKATWMLMAIFLISSLALAKRETSARIAKESAINKKSAIEEIDLKDDAPEATDVLKSATTDAENKAAAKTEEATK
ncbi:MAG: preprotein translocase subunit SecG, partial [Lentisphaeraceae bacterium]|nr:preprotein translocase subunit SecG [Lentisphaeraceae bacterium]